MRAILLGLLAAGVLVPLVRLVWRVLSEGGAVAPLRHVDLLLNSVAAGLLVPLLGSAIGVPLAVLAVRCAFPGRTILWTLALVPLVVPPYVGALAFRQLLGRGGAMEGLGEVVVVQALHAFPFIMLHTAAALSALDPSLEEAAETLGASGLRSLRRVLAPLALPGYLAGFLLAFVRVVDDVGTPLVLGYSRLLAPQAYLRVSVGGAGDADGVLLATVLLTLSLLAFGGSRAILRLSPRSGVGGERPGLSRPLRRISPVGAWLLGGILLAPALLLPLVLLVLSLSTTWAALLPPGGSLERSAAIFREAPGFVLNTLRYAVPAALVDVALGAAVGWLALRGRTERSGGAAALAALPLAVPGVPLAVGYLLAFGGSTMPGPLASTWLALVTVYAVRRLPYAVEGARAALHPHPVALEEAAQTLGVSPPRAFLRVTAPLMGRGLVAGGLVAFATAAAELPATLILVPRVELGPLSYGTFAWAGSPEGTGPGAVLAVILVALAGGGTWLAARLGPRGAAARLLSL